MRKEQWEYLNRPITQEHTYFDIVEREGRNWGEIVWDSWIKVKVRKIYKLLSGKFLDVLEHLE